MNETTNTAEIVRRRLADGRTIADADVHRLVAEIGRLRERLRLAEAVCQAVWEHEQADDALMSGARIGAVVQAWHDAEVDDGDPKLEAEACAKYEAWHRRHPTEPAWTDLKEWVRGNWRIAARVDRREAGR